MRGRVKEDRKWEEKMVAEWLVRGNSTKGSWFESRQQLSFSNSRWKDRTRRGTKESVKKDRKLGRSNGSVVSWRKFNNGFLVRIPPTTMIYFQSPLEGENEKKHERKR